MTDLRQLPSNHPQNELRAMVLGLAALALLCGGCAGFRQKFGIANDVKPTLDERHSETVRNFESRRDNAQLQGALARFRSGNTAEAQDLIGVIVKRNPEHLAARIAMAELLLMQDNPEEALQHLEFVAKRAPNDVSTKHLLGVAHEALGQMDVALACYQQAAKLEPQNEIYQTSYQCALEAAGGRPAANLASLPATAPTTAAADRAPAVR
jgi:tetratricopeptide (TPR) repeat protein